MAAPSFPTYTPEQIALINAIYGKGAYPGTPAKGQTRDLTPTLGPPPQGTYDRALDYNSSAAQRGYNQTFNDAQTAYEQGQQDYGLGLGDLTRSRDYNLQDLGTSQDRLQGDYGINNAELHRGYEILGHQQAEGAAQRGVTSAGLLGKSAATRNANLGWDQNKLDVGLARGLQDVRTQRDRTNTAFDQGKTRLDLGNVRAFGGFNGNGLLNPLTGQAEAGSLLTGTQRAFTENDAYQGGILGQKIQQAQQGGYQSPLLNPAFDQADYLKRLRAFQKGQ